jgi:L-2,4-diaminobutyrate decarboxylase
LAEAAPGAVLLVQSDVHYSILRASGVLGLGTGQVLKVPLDDRRRMNPTALDHLLQQVRGSGRLPIAVCAAACATPTGAFDPLRLVAEVCRRHSVWLHVDAAHGGGALMSERHRGLLDGLELADSIVIDAHKMMFVPALCAFVIYRDQRHRFQTFQQDAPYLFDPASPGMAEFDNGTQTLECTKRAAAFGLWGLWSVFGPGLFGQLVDRCFQTTRNLADMLSDAPDFHLLYQPESNILVFRYVPDTVGCWPIDRLGDFQLELRRRIVMSGDAYLVPIKIEGVGALRTTVINPLTDESDLRALLEIVRRHGENLCRSSRYG